MHLKCKKICKKCRVFCFFKGANSSDSKQVPFFATETVVSMLRNCWDGGEDFRWWGGAPMVEEELGR